MPVHKRGLVLLSATVALSTTVSSTAIVSAGRFAPDTAALPESSAGQTTTATGPRLQHAVGFFDARLRRVVLVGGPADAKAGNREQVWSWSGSRWELVTMAGPPSRTNAAGAYDVRTGKAIVSGGSAQSANSSTWEVLGDSWAGDGSGWSRIGDIEPRDHQSMVADKRGAVLMYGGIPSERSGPWPTDTWELGPDGWTRVASDGPAARGRSALAFDAARGQVVLFGGVSAPSSADKRQTFLSDTWVWQDAKWRKVADDGPPGRYAHGMVFDERAKVVLMYSGSAAHSNAPLTDMWQWDGNHWTEIRMTGPTPGHRYQPVMVYDQARDRTVLYGGIGEAKDETWEWDGQRWQEIRP